MCKRGIILFITGVFLTFVGCATTKNHNLTPANLYDKPIVQVYQDPSFNPSNYKTFSVFGSSVIKEKTELGGGILEKQMLFALRNFLERNGYRFVDLDKSPDLLVTMDGSAPYKEKYIPPQTVTVPYWVPGQTITIETTKSGFFDFNTFGSYSSFGWGTYLGTSTSTIHTPSYWTTQTYTRPGYTVGAFYPSIVVNVFDAKTRQNLWNGYGIGATKNPDLRVSSQFILWDLFNRFPMCPYANQNFPTGNLFYGIMFQVQTNDGNNYFPTVINLKPDSLASKAGVEIYDMVLSINGFLTYNKPLSEIYALTGGSAGGKVSMTIWRNGGRFEVQLLSDSRR